MAQPDSDRELRRTGGRQLETGSRLLLAGGVLFAVGLVLMLIADGAGDFLGVALAALATPPTLAGVAMTASGLVSRRASAQRPFA
jgi:hypothetical protein